MGFGIEDEKKEAGVEKSALEQEEWFVKIKDGVARFMRK